MRPIRVHVDAPLQARSRCTLPASSARHVVSVLRLAAGDAVTLFDGRGGEYAAVLVQSDRRGAVAEVGEHRPIERESPLETTLLQGLVRGEKMDLLVQKATELGVSRIVPVAAARSVARIASEGDARKKLEHWRAVAASACEQCGRNRLPAIEAPLSLDAALALTQDAALRALLAPAANFGFAARLHASRPASVAILIGPEGGFDEAEAALAGRLGFESLRFGPRVLRTETAAIAALTVLQALAGDLA